MNNNYKAHPTELLGFELAEIIEGTIFWAVWCNHYKDTTTYWKMKDKDLREHALYIANKLWDKGITLKENDEEENSRH